MIHMLCGGGGVYHTTYKQVVYILYEQVVYIFITEKYIPYYTEQVHNESIDMTYLRKRYMNIALAGNNI